MGDWIREIHLKRGWSGFWRIPNFDKRIVTLHIFTDIPHKLHCICSFHLAVAPLTHSS